MEDDNVYTDGPCEPIYFEKKCEREFRKLLQSDDQSPDYVTYSKTFTDLRNSKKRLKIDEEDYDSSSSFDSLQYDENLKRLRPQREMVPSNLAPVYTQDEMRKSTFHFATLYENLNRDYPMDIRCRSAISLALLCSEEVREGHLNVILKVMDRLLNSHESDALALCHAVLLLSLSTRDLSLNKISYLEDLILRLADSVIVNKSPFGNRFIGSRLTLLRGEYYLTAYRLCRRFFIEKQLDINCLDVLTICCRSLRNLTKCDIGQTYKYKDSTLKFILGMTGKATQEIVSEHLVQSEEDEAVVRPSSCMVNQCLQILEHMLSRDADAHCKTLDHEDFSLLHCLTRLLGWCMTFVFKTAEQTDNNYRQYVQNSLTSFHLSTLISILKILSVLSFNPDQYSSFTNIKGLMEKIMICILKAYYQSEENRFDVLVLALELMINFFLKNKRTFVLLCLKKFQISGCEQVLSIEALLKILSNSLDKINEIKERLLIATPQENPQNNPENVDVGNLHIVLEAADEDMMLSTIVSFISVLIAFFMDTKTSFVEFVRERLSLEKSTEAISVSRKFLQFASITGGMPTTGINLMRHTIKKLSELYPTTS